MVINSLRGGAAAGGTRMRQGLDKREVESLAKTMEVKFTVPGPAIGGAKSGINFDPHDPRKRGVLERWYKAVIPLLKKYYGTGGDLNVDEIHDVIPITEDYGLWHPQEGIVNGHYHATEPQKIQKLGQLRQGVVKVIEDATFTPSLARKYTVADLITGYGVAEAVRHYYELWGGELAGKRALIQGWGNVGAAAAYYLASQGVRVTGIIDRAGGLLSEDGFSLEDIRQLFLDRKNNTLTTSDLLSFEEISQRIWSSGAEIFIPAASSRLVTRGQVEQMLAGGLEVISCGANVPFQDPEIFFGPTGEYADQHASVIPDFIANCGMARVFAYLMETNVEITDQAIFGDTSRVIRRALERTRQQGNDRTGLAQKSFEMALRELV
ncbi:Glu/Leu/Phe/Val dehydrogenase [Hymenobacter roseosalivarius DSM 11622]|uniref:Glu/Leu/Phe/Val dehydrogenase n=1 Tax=Hymenobacter roseosalivarius DSM 11622 TaxID=645990 RepID=A0A1W1ULN1_9BACT|nr:Glu/Leu/Phe/Val dehydrogenase [Hymenobacter roseosalivarius DSM 11622]